MKPSPQTVMDRSSVSALGRRLGLSVAELKHIESALGRLPSQTEIALFAGMWSEHCAYKSTKHLLQTLPRTGPAVLAGPGSHAGVVDVGDGLGVAFKIESHNHPSAVDPYQGAATGVGGILRDIVAQGARPCAVMDALCLGPPQNARAQHLARGIVQGIGGYGNAFGVANVGGKTVYDRRYEGNPLVNALAAGLVRHTDMRTAKARGVGNALLYVGAATGRDGILGAAFASENLKDDQEQSRPHVQVGDPFAGKKLMEACLGFTPAMGLIACQDLGACGISCAATEMAAAGEVGLHVELDTIPLREAGMTPQEILLSESQERFMFVVQAGREDAALAHFRSHGVLAVVCGRVVPGHAVAIVYRGAVCVEVSAALVAGGAPASAWPVAETLPEATPYQPFAPAPPAETLQRLLREPCIGSLEAVTQRYDQTVGNRTVRGPGDAAAAVVKLPSSQRGFALTLTGRGEQCAADAYLGSQAALGQAVRDLACVGAPLLAITDGLNMASPRDPLEMRKIVEVVAGLRDGLKALNVAVTGGNVSLYNESPAGPIPPTVLVGAIGLVDNVSVVPRRALQAGDVLFFAGTLRDDAVFSRFARLQTGVDSGHAPAVDLPAEQALAAFVIEQVRAGRVQSALGPSLGGMAVSLAKMCIQGACGAHVALPLGARHDWALFGEYPATAWLAVRPEHADALAQQAPMAVALHRAGVAGGQDLCIDGALTLPVADLRRAFAGASR